jgi:hypothetical protein
VANTEDVFNIIPTSLIPPSPRTPVQNREFGYEYHKKEL